MQYYSSKTVNLHAIERVDTAIISDVDSELSVRTPSVCYRTIAHQRRSPKRFATRQQRALWLGTPHIVDSRLAEVVSNLPAITH